MKEGKKKCDDLRLLRHLIADKFGLKYVPRECHHEGDCPGTCPACDAELLDLQRQLDAMGVKKIDLGDKPEFFQALLAENGARNSPQPDEDGMGQNLDQDPGNELEGDIPPGGALYFDEPYMTCKIAGLMFRDISDVWDELYEGARLALVREPDNEHDTNAIAVALDGDYDPYHPESFDFDLILGYIPRADNADLAEMMDSGIRSYAEISELHGSAHSYKSIEINIFVDHGEGRLPSDRLRVVNVGNLAEHEQWLRDKGAMYFRWRYQWHVAPLAGEAIVVMSRGATESVMYLTRVIAVGEDAKLFFDDPDDIVLDDDCHAYILGNISGPKTVPGWALDFLNKEDVGEWMPGKFVSRAAQEKLGLIFGVKMA